MIVASLLSKTATKWCTSSSYIHLISRSLNSNTAGICKIHRAIYAKTYPTVVVLPDGSSFSIRYHEPRQIIRLPVDLSLLTEQQRLARLEKRKPKTKIVIEEEVDEHFDATEYLTLIKN